MKKLRKDELICELEREYLSWDKSGRDNIRMGSAHYTSDLHPYTGLFSPIEYNGLSVKNKVVFIPPQGFRMELKDGAPTPSAISYYLERAHGGTGLLCTPPIEVRTAAFGSEHWRELTEGVHSRGAAIMAQLDLESAHIDPASPLSPDVHFTKLIRIAAQAAANAVSAGFDGICLCGMEGTLLDKMSSRAWNRKLLGRFRDPVAFGTALTHEIRQRIGDSLPIMYRIVLSHAVSESYGESVSQHAELKSSLRQRTIAHSLSYMEKLALSGVDMFELGLGCCETPWLLSPAAAMPAGCYLDVSRAVLDYFKAVGARALSGKNLCVISSAKLECPDIAEAALREGMCTAVAQGSAICADPNWCEKAAGGRCADIIPFYAPASGIDFNITPAPRKRTAVVGGGMRGMLYALKAAKNGHKVTLYEASGKPGGRLLALSRSGIDCAAENYLRSLIRRINNCGSISVKLSTKADTEILKAGGFESVVFATGNKCAVPAIPGWGEIPFAYAADVMKRPETLPDVSGKNIAVLGGGELGCSCAWWLKSQLDCKRIAIIHDSPYIMEGSSENDRTWMIHHVELKGSLLATMSTPTKISDGWLYFEERAVGEKPAANCTWLPETAFESLSEESTLRCIRPDLIILADEGSKSTALYEEAKRSSVAPEIILI